MQATAEVVRVRPKYSLLSNAFAAIVLGTAPIFGVMYWFAAARGGVEYVVLANILVLAAGLLLLWRQLSVYCAVTETELIGNGIFSPLVRVPLARIRGVVLVPTYLGAAPDPALQLLALGEGDVPLFRMRGNFWHERDLHELANALPCTVENVREPMSLQDFFRAYPGSAYWFENRRPLQVAIVAVAVLLGLAVAVWVMTALGPPHPLPVSSP